MSQTHLSPTERLSRQRRYRRLMYGSIAVGVVANLLLRYAEYPLAAELVYLICGAAFFVVPAVSSVQLFDERDADLERRASMTTIVVFAPVLILGASAARLLSQVLGYDVPAMVWGALYGYVALFAVFGVAYLWHSNR